MTEPLVLPASDPRSIMTVAQILREGGVAAIPTDTVYGLSASVFQPAAVERVYQLKKRAPEVRVPILFATAADLPILVSDIPRLAWLLMEEFWPGPLTLVLPATRSAPGWITRGGDTVAVRVPAARPTLELLQVLGEPVLGTSANISGQPPALTANEALGQLPGVDAILAGDEVVQSGLASTVVEISPNNLTILRAGAVGADRIREVVGTRIMVGRALVPPPASG